MFYTSFWISFKISTFYGFIFLSRRLSLPSCVLSLTFCSRVILILSLPDFFLTVSEFLYTLVLFSDL